MLRWECFFNWLQELSSNLSHCSCFASTSLPLKMHDHINYQPRWLYQCFQKESDMSFVESEIEAKTDMKGNKHSYAFQPSLMNPAKEKGNRLFYFTAVFHSHHVFNTFPLPQWSLRLVISNVLKRANQTVRKAILPQTSSKAALPIGHPVSRQHSHFPAQWSSTLWPLPRPPPQQPKLQHQLQPREQARATSTYLWAISHSAAPIGDPALAHLTQHSCCTLHRSTPAGPGGHGWRVVVVVVGLRDH